ncbi:sugar phosphate isomerase/epimerase [Luminiphilus sp.]|nr:sugar phosphate isomerase/epimerase [Luminiphilus sp.]
MQLSVSNIACHDVEGGDFYSAMQQAGFTRIDVAPTKFWPAWEYDRTSAGRFKSLFAEFGLTAAGLQSLFYGTDNLNVFSKSQDHWQDCVNHIDKVADIASILGVTHLVFGSPKNRDPGDFERDSAAEMAIIRFRQLADVCQAKGVILCIEPVPEQYGGTFLTNTKDTAHFIRRANHDALKMNLDTGVLRITGADAYKAVTQAFDTIGHVHASEPQLKNLDTPESDHAAVAKALKDNNYAGTVAIEMLTQPETSVDELNRALNFVNATYG